MRYGPSDERVALRPIRGDDARDNAPESDLGDAEGDDGKGIGESDGDGEMSLGDRLGEARGKGGMSSPGELEELARGAAREVCSACFAARNSVVEDARGRLVLDRESPVEGECALSKRVRRLRT